MYWGFSKWASVWEIFKMALGHVFMWQSVEMLKNVNILTLRQTFRKTKTIFKKLDYRFLVESNKNKTHHFHIKLPLQKPMLKQTEWWQQNWPITKNRVLPVTNLFFWKFCFSLRTSYKELIWCTKCAHVRTFCIR